MALFGLTRELRAFLERIERKADAILGGLIRLNHETERIGSSMSEQFDQLQQVVGNVETAVGNVGTRLAAEVEQIRLEIERLNNANPSIDLTPAIQRLNGVETELNSIGTKIGDIIQDAQPEPPAPEGRRR